MALRGSVTWPRVATARFAGLFGRRKGDRELEDELRAHLDALVAENIGRGMAADEARRAAQREFGGIEQTKESYRQQRGLPFLETFEQDVRFGLRGLWKHRGFASLAFLTLALGIGVNTSLFTVVHSVLLRPLPFPEPERLVSLFERGVSDDNHDNVVAGGQFEDWQSQATSFARMAVVGEDSANLSGDGNTLPEAIGTRFCSYSLFSILGWCSFFPSWRASRCDPLVALRCE